MSRYTNLNPKKALIWRIVHRDNVPWIMDNGLHCASSGVQDPNYVAIGNADLIDRRSRRPVPIAPGGVLSDYVPFYFTPFTPMMYNIHTGRAGVTRRSNSEICILVSSLPRVKEHRLQFVFTDRHAYPIAARYFHDLDDLAEIDWPHLQARDFKYDPENPKKMEFYQAEALIYRYLPITALLGLVCYNDHTKQHLNQYAETRNLSLDVRALPGWYF